MARRRFQKGTIRERGRRNPIWELQWWADFIKPDGSIGRKRESVILGSLSNMTRKQARKAAEEVLQPLNSGKATPHATVTLREFVERVYIPYGLPVLKLSTRKRYRTTLNKHLLPAFGEYRLCDIKTLDLQRFVLEKHDSGSGWEAVNHFKNLMSKIYSTAKKWDHFNGENPASGVELPEKEPVREKHVLTPEQISLLLRGLKEPVRTMVFLGINTGLRVGEILGLRWQDVDLTRRELTVSQAVYRGITGTPKTKSSRRTLPIPESLLAELALHYRRSRHRDGPQLVFQTSKGTAYSDTNLLHRDLKPAGKKLGMAWLSWHTFRRTHCTLFQEAGGCLKDAQAQLGHSKSSITMDVYTLSIPGHQREAVEKLSQMVTNGDKSPKNAGEPPMLTEQIQ